MISSFDQMHPSIPEKVGAPGEANAAPPTQQYDTGHSATQTRARSGRGIPMESVIGRRSNLRFGLLFAM
eukprot:4684999-Amphidinium_carterae.1